MLQKKNVVVFDFDGTLSASDSNYEFFKYCFKKSIKPWFYMPLVFVGLIGRIFNRDAIWWREFMRRFISKDMVKKLAPDFIKWHKKRRFAWAKKQVSAEKKAGNITVLISAGPDYLIPFLVSDMDFDVVICSRMNKEKPWKYDFLCWGGNKVVALDNWAKEKKYIPRVVRSYSDSKTDLPMMKIAGEEVWIDRKNGQRI